MNSWLTDNLACPRHHGELFLKEDTLVCPKGCQYPVVNDIPILLLDDVSQTMDLAAASLRLARQRNGRDDLYVESVGVTDKQKRGILELAAKKTTDIDPVVSFLIGATNGNAYKSLIGKLAEYPIPRLRLPAGGGKTLLDLGCSWGRWSIAAARKGYNVVGIDPSLGAVMAAKRVARQLGVEAAYVVGDARFLPFKPSVVDCIFSYSVLQHLSREDAAQVVDEINRVLKPNGQSLIEMPAKFGLRCLYQQARRGFRDGRGFEVRYWSTPELRRLFSSRIGPTSFSVDCFFGIGLQFSDLRLMPASLKIVVQASECLRLASQVFRPLVWVADSVYVSSVKGAS
jgi:2-polyprenyl-3-methyl-5-hydroxy-6-metoxy-1,4-benzoquinol methylase/uncharacterized protein YbaR (Trm112 family)